MGQNGGVYMCVTRVVCVRVVIIGTIIVVLAGGGVCLGICNARVSEYVVL